MAAPSGRRERERGRREMEGVCGGQEGKKKGGGGGVVILLESCKSQLNCSLFLLSYGKIVEKSSFSDPFFSLSFPFYIKFSYPLTLQYAEIQHKYIMVKKCFVLFVSIIYNFNTLNSEGFDSFTCYILYFP